MTGKDTPVADRTAETRRQSAQRLPADVTAAFDTELARLTGLGVPSGIAVPGAATCATWTVSPRP